MLYFPRHARRKTAERTKKALAEHPDYAREEQAAALSFALPPPPRGENRMYRFGALARYVCLDQNVYYNIKCRAKMAPLYPLRWITYPIGLLFIRTNLQSFAYPGGSIIVKFTEIRSID